MQDQVGFEEPDTQKVKRPWTARSIGSAFQHQIFYTMIRLGGRRLANFALAFVVAWYILFRPSVRHRCNFYLSRRFPGVRGFRSLLNCYELSHALGQVLVDRAVLGILGPEVITCSLAGRELLQSLLKEGNGLILLTSHVGCWQLGMASLRCLDTPLNLLIHREEGDVDRHFFEHGTETSPYRIIEPGGPLGGVLEMLSALEAKELLCIMGDRVMGGPSNTIAVHFLGGAIQVPFSPYKLASATGAPIAVIFPYHAGSGRYALRVARIIRVPENLGRNSSAYRVYTEQYIQVLEEFVHDYPYQFFNFFNMWAAPSA